LRFTLLVNGQEHVVAADPATCLLPVLHEQLGLFGARLGCGAGECGACVVLLDGAPFASCTMQIQQVEGREITTVEGLARGESLHPLQEAFVAEDALQCGFCTSGLLMAAAALLTRTPSPTEDEIREALAGHLCRCGVYGRIVRAVRRAAADRAR